MPARMMSVAHQRDLAAAREDAAAFLEAAIANLAPAWRNFEHATRVLEQASGISLSPGADNAIVLHLAAAGLGSVLARKLVGSPPNLRDLVASQHTRIAGLGEPEP